MHENPYESPQTYSAPAPAKRKWSSATIWFTVSTVAWAGMAIVWSIGQALPRDRIWPDRLNANESYLIHMAVAVLLLICISTGVVTTCVGVLAVLRR